MRPRILFYHHSFKILHTFKFLGPYIIERNKKMSFAYRINLLNLDLFFIFLQIFFPLARAHEFQLQP